MSATNANKTHPACQIRASLLAEIVVPPGLPDFSNDLVYSPQLAALHAKEFLDPKTISNQNAPRAAPTKEDSQINSRRAA